MESILEAQQLNNQGVKALERGDDESALTSLAKAIRILKQQIASAPNPEDDAVDEDSKKMSFASSAQHSTVMLPEMGEQHQSFIFNEALNLSRPPGSQYDEELTEHDVHVYTGVVIFNLALAHHRRGKDGQVATGRGGCLTKADKLYGMALKVLAHDFTNSVSVLVKLASINNMAEIRFEMGDNDSARTGLQLLSKLLQQCSDSTLSNSTRSMSSSIADSPMFQEPQIQGLLMNVLLLRAPKVAPAA